jgi:hypothetical protein
MCFTGTQLATGALNSEHPAKALWNDVLQGKRRRGSLIAIDAPISAAPVVLSTINVLTFHFCQMSEFHNRSRMSARSKGDLLI